MDTNKMREHWATPDVHYIAECLEIDDAGDLVWRTRPRSHFATQRAFSTWNSKHAGKKAGSISLNPKSVTSYRVLVMNIAGKQVHLYGHRVAWAIHYGEWPAGYLDHIDGNGLNNTISNLRIVDMAESGTNKPAQRNNKTGVPGVSIDRRGRYRVYGCLAGESMHLGYYTDFFEAACAKKSFEAANGFHVNHGRQSIEAQGLKVAP